MSIEKLSDASKTELEHIPFAQICNSVIEHIKDNDAFRMYCYLVMKSRDWVVIKNWTAKVCKIGERKAKQCWAYLERCGLIQYITIRDEKGKFVKHDIRVLNGTKFNQEEPFLKPTGAETALLDLEKLSTNELTHRCNNPPSGESTRVDFAPLLKKEITNKDFNTKKRKSFCASAQKKPKSKSTSAAQKPTSPAKAAKSSPPKVTKAEWRKQNSVRHSFADSKTQAALSQPAMAREAQHIAESEVFKRAPMPEKLREQIKQLKRHIIADERKPSGKKN